MQKELHSDLFLTGILECTLSKTCFMHLNCFPWLPLTLNIASFFIWKVEMFVILVVEIFPNCVHKPVNDKFKHLFSFISLL